MYTRCVSAWAASSVWQSAWFAITPTQNQQVSGHQLLEKLSKGQKRSSGSLLVQLTSGFQGFLPLAELGIPWMQALAEPLDVRCPHRGHCAAQARPKGITPAR